MAQLRLDPRGVALVAFFVTMANYGDLQAQSLTGEQHVRDVWYIGFGIGSGDGSYKTDETKITFDDVTKGADSAMTLGLEFKVGYTALPNLLVGLDVAGMRTQGDATGVSVALQLNSYDAVATYFPLGEGVFVRGGAGLAGIVAQLVILDTQLESSLRGYGGMAGFGYEAWLGDSFNLSVNFDYHMHRYSGDAHEPESGSFYLAYVGFGWY
jgi:hypothetical protein